MLQLVEEAPVCSLVENVLLKAWLYGVVGLTDDHTHTHQEWYLSFMANERHDVHLFVGLMALHRPPPSSWLISPPRRPCGDVAAHLCHYTSGNVKGGHESTLSDFLHISFYILPHNVNSNRPPPDKRHLGKTKDKIKVHHPS